MTALRRGIVLGALVLILAAAGGTFALLRVSATPDNAMAVDATSGGAVDGSRTVTGPGTGEFDIGINIVAPVSPAYAGYQAVIRYDSAVINFVPVTVNEAGSTVAIAAGDCNDGLDNDGDGDVDGDDVQCARAGKNVNYLPVGALTLLTAANDAAVSGSLRKTSTGAAKVGTTSFAGQMLVARYKCVANGTTSLHLIANGEAAAYSTTTGTGGAIIPTSLTDATITCEGFAEAPTPTPTSTTVPATDTPTPTSTTVPATDTPTPTSTTVPATDTPTPTSTTAPPTNTPTPTSTTVPATDTPTPTSTTVPPTNTPTPTSTTVPPTNTPTATSTTAPPTNTPTPTSTTVPGAGNALAVDATSGGAVDGTRTVTGPGTGEFDIGVNITAAPTPYAGYQAIIRYDSAVINFVPVDVNEAGSTVALAAGDCNDGLDNDGDTNVDGDDPQCARSGKNVNYLPVGSMSLLTGATDAAVSGSLRKTSMGAARGSGTTSFAGQMLIARYRCVANGTTSLHLLALGEAAAYSTTTGAGGAIILTSLTDATITCQGFAEPTPTSTPTPAATSTPTPTPTPAAECTFSDDFARGTSFLVTGRSGRFIGPNVDVSGIRVLRIKNKAIAVGFRGGAMVSGQGTCPAGPGSFRLLKIFPFPPTRLLLQDVTP